MRVLTGSVFCALLAASSVLADTPHVAAIDLSPTEHGAQVVIRASSQPEFSVFRLKNPSRVVIDMPGVDLSGVKAPAGLDFVQTVTTTQFRGRTGPVGRVVIVFSAEAEVDAVGQGADIVVKAVRTTTPIAPQANVVKPTTIPSAAHAETPVIVLEGEGDVGASARRLFDVVAKEQGSGALVQVKTDGEVLRYEIDQLVQPDKLVIDLLGVTTEKHAERIFAGTALQGARIGKHADRTRIVLDARGALPRFDVASTSEGLAILFASGATPPASVVDLRGMSFDKRNGFWRLRLETGGSVAVRTVKSSPEERILALDGVRLTEAQLAARIPTGGPVTQISLTRDPHRTDSIRISLRLSEPIEQSVWQRDGSVYWDARSVGAPPPATVASLDRVQPAAAPFASGPMTLAQQGIISASYRGKKITIDLMDADIVNVVRLIGDVSGKNVVVGEDVKGKVTLKLKNVPWDQALDVVLKTKDLGQETRGGIIRVVPQAKLDAEREARLKLQEDREKKLPTTMRLIAVNYAVAKELVPQVKELLSARGKVTQDERTNVIIVEDIRDNLDQAERLVRTLDTQTPQVLIEARMVEGNTNFTRALGIQWGGGLFFSQRGGNPTGLVFPSNVGVVGGADTAQSLQGGQPTPGVPFPTNFAVNLPAQNVTSGIGLNLGSVGNFGFVNARLTAAEASGQAKIVSAPRITTLNNKKARITQGTDITVPVVTLNQLETKTIKAALELEVTPHVTADGSILMSIKLTNNVPDFSQDVGSVPPVATKEAETEMLVKDGDTAVIGGIYTRNQAESFEQTPFLGSIPIIGWLFKSANESDTRTEMLVFITPRIVNRRGATQQGGGGL